MANLLKIKLRSPAQTRKLAAEILKDLAKSGTKKHVLALTGALGSGKTTFVQGLAAVLGVKEKVKSPTFVLMKVYVLRKKPFRHLVHIDAYRLAHPQELRQLGADKILGDPANLVVIEWAERVKKLIPRTAVWIRFVHASRNMRIIRI